MRPRRELGIGATVSDPRDLTGIRPCNFREADFRPGITSSWLVTHPVALSQSRKRCGRSTVPRLYRGEPEPIPELFQDQ